MMRKKSCIPNGNMVKDRNKGISNIRYNHLNLPTQIEFEGTNNKITYLYNSLGQKLKKTVVYSDSIKIVDYLDGFQTEERGSRTPVGALATQLSNNEQYAGVILQFFPHAEGYVKATPIDRLNTDYGYNYVFNYTDHLGNVRVSYSKDPQTNQLKILEENHYYPFGLKHSVYTAGRLRDFEVDFSNPADIKVFLTPVTKTEYQYKYNSFEYQDELGLNWYDYMARNYNPAIARWGVPDPLADIASDRTPHHFVSNNPLNRIDPDGLTDFTLNKKTGEITQVGEVNDNPDRILKTNRKGKVKHDKNGEAKVGIDNISKGILKDGLNLKENDITFRVNGEEQPTLEEFNSFISRFSDYVGKEIAGIRLGESDSEQVLRVKTYKYNKNTKVKSQTPKSWLTIYGDYLKGHFHTHPYHDHTPSEKDERLKSQYPDIPFYIIAGGHEKKF